MTLVAPAIALVGITGCSTAGPIAEHNYTHTYVTISHRAYNAAGFDRAWPFGPNPLNNNQEYGPGKQDRAGETETCSEVSLKVEIPI
ncbi:MAG: hypothetical protein JO279_10070 [Verrucomicrobia bacterium]|nr:hypothetical protein [Verrucomicrobiota bacterium]